MQRKRIGDLLVEAGLLTEDELNQALREKNPGEKIGKYLVRIGKLTEQQIVSALEVQLNIPQVHLNQLTIDEEVMRIIPKELAKSANVIPIHKDRNQLYVAMSDPMNYFIIEELRLATGLQIIPRLATETELEKSVMRHYELRESMEAAMTDVEAEQLTHIDMNAMEEEEETPVIRLVNQILADAITQGASDIHFDSQEYDFRIRYRVDGVLRTERVLPKNMQNVLIARVKIMAKLNITESRIPQDGRIKTVVDQKPVDLRVSTLPTVHGEKVVMRILDMGSSMNSIDKLGMSDVHLERFKKMIQAPNGIVLVTGPTGSGKSSTLYAALNTLNTDQVNIITVEDPVEFRLEGANQIQVKEEVGLTFAAGLRSILRQDPDIVMIGEIRDLETAEIAVRTSLTGHLVLSTLHTNSAVESVTRLKDMGIEPFLIASAVNGVVAQRLVRRVCRDCLEPVEVTEANRPVFEQYGLIPGRVMKGKGCPSCNDTGYRGRVAVHEVLPINEKIREIIMTTMSIREIQEEMKRAGIFTMYEDGIEKVNEGLTSLEEVLRVTTLE